MINRKSRDEIKRMVHAGHIVALVHQKMKEVVEPGISTKELDNIAMKIIKEKDSYLKHIQQLMNMMQISLKTIHILNGK